jgi:hypothetical protein
VRPDDRGKRPEPRSGEDEQKALFDEAAMKKDLEQTVDMEVLGTALGLANMIYLDPAAKISQSVKENPNTNQEDRLFDTTAMRRDKTSLNLEQLDFAMMLMGMRYQESDELGK